MLYLLEAGLVRAAAAHIRLGPAVLEEMALATFRPVLNVMMSQRGWLSGGSYEQKSPLKFESTDSISLPTTIQLNYPTWPSLRPLRPDRILLDHQHGCTWI